VSSGKPVLLQGSDLPLWGMEVDPEEGKAEFAAYNKTNDTGKQVGPAAARRARGGAGRGRAGPRRGHRR
jgi:arsenite-transporting ATPase